MSRIGKKPIEIPNNVKVQIENGAITIEGPKGALKYALADGISAELKDHNIYISRASEQKLHKSLHGLSHSLVRNMLQGVTVGFLRELQIEGMGFRAQVQGKTLNLNLGFTHTIAYPVPEGIVVEAPKPNQILVKGIDRHKVGEVAAQIRAYFPPEPYKGKGVRYLGEYVRKKAGKALAATGAAAGGTGGK